MVRVPTGKIWMKTYLQKPYYNLSFPKSCNSHNHDNVNTLVDLQKTEIQREEDKKSNNFYACCKYER